MFAIYSKSVNGGRFVPFDISQMRTVKKENVPTYTAEDQQFLNEQVKKLNASKRYQKFEIRTIKN